jgi:hypothetical protein
MKHFNPSISHDNFIQTLNHEVLKDVKILFKTFYSMLTFKRKFNKEWEEQNKKVIYFRCHMERHISFSFLISRAMMVTLAKKRGTNILMMATKEAYRPRS